jgi:hypothetical protein
LGAPFQPFGDSTSVGRVARWVIFVFFAWQTVDSAGAAIWWGTEGKSGDAGLAVFVAVGCGLIAWWVGFLIRPRLIRR